MVDRQVVPFLKSDTEKTVHGVEDAIFQHPVQLEIGTYFCFVNIILFFAHFFCVDSQSQGCTSPSMPSRRIISSISSASCSVLRITAGIRSLSISRTASGVCAV